MAFSANTLFKNWNVRVLCLVLLVSSIITLILTWSVEEAQLRGSAEDSNTLAPFPMASKRSSVPGVGYVFLALGAQANQMNCPAAIESLVKYGGWGGDVYLLTDRNDCFDEDTIVRNADMDKAKFHMITTQESYSDGGIDIWNSHMGTRKNRIRSFTVKAQIFDYVTDRSIHTLAFADCDVLFGKPDCATEYVQSAIPFAEDEAIKFSRVHVQPGTKDVYNIHSGSFVAHRTKSAFMLKQWRTELEKFIYEHDRDGLVAAYREGKRQQRPLSEYYPGELSRHYERFFNATEMTLRPPACINHISKARCASEGREAVQAFVNRFQLKSYMKPSFFFSAAPTTAAVTPTSAASVDTAVVGDASAASPRRLLPPSNFYHYCPHPTVQPLLYGWFPFSMVPMCPKVEALL